MPKDITKLSNSLGSSLAKLHKAGGPLLVFIFVGVLTMTSGNFFGGAHSGAVFAVAPSQT